MRRGLLIALGLALVGALLVWIGLRIPAVQDRILTRAIQRVASDRAEVLFRDDALRVLVCGSSSPLPNPDRAKPCLAVFAGGRFWIVDTGLGAWRNLALWHVPGERIGGILLTHFHSDHIGALGEFNLQTWVAGRPGPLRVFGPPGVKRVVAGFEEAYALDTGYRIAHHGAALLDPQTGRMQAVPVAIAAGASEAPVLEEGGLRITALKVDHRPVVPAYGYRFDYRGRSVVVSGDTTKNAGLEQAAKGADVLVHEAQSNHLVALMEQAMRDAGRPRMAKILHDIPEYHTTPVEAAEIANAAGVKLLVLTHLTPPPGNALVERVFLRGVSDVRPKGWILGWDGLLVELPIGSDEVGVRSLD